MNIPSEYLSSQEFWRRLVQIATRLLKQVKFPENSYDDDLDALAEDIVQTTLMRILEKADPDEPIRNWPGFCYGVMRYVIFEERRAVWRPFGAARRKIPEASGEDGETHLPLEELVADPAPLIDKRLEQEDLWKIIDEEVPKVCDNPRFRDFVELCLLSEYSLNAAWTAVSGSDTGGSRATYYRWWRSLSLAVMMRWASLGVEVKGGV